MLVGFEIKRIGFDFDRLFKYNDAHGQSYQNAMSNNSRIQSREVSNTVRKPLANLMDSQSSFIHSPNLESRERQLMLRLEKLAQREGLR